jgi:hypothetical protein
LRALSKITFISSLVVVLYSGLLINISSLLLTKNRVGYSLPKFKSEVQLLKNLEMKVKNLDLK